MRKRWIITATAVVVVLLLTVVVWGLACDKGIAWWSAWGQWFGGAGAIAAAIVALSIAHIGWLRADAEHHRQEAERQDREKAQARLVHGELMPLDARWDIRQHVRQFAIYNRSSAAIFQAVITYLDGPWHNGQGEGFPDPTPLTPATVESGSHHAVSVTDLLNANVFVRFEPDRSEPDDFVVTVRFMDANGLWWERTGLSEPERIEPDGTRL